MKHKGIGILTVSFLAVIAAAFCAYAEIGPGYSLQKANEALQTGTAGTDAADKISDETKGETVQVNTLDEKAALLKTSKTAKLTDQIILVTDHDLALFDRQADGTWKAALETYCGYGRNGLKAAEKRQEGDGTTPIGAFPILHAFGQTDNPGTAMTWKKITKDSYWSGEESTYNTWVESKNKIEGEHLIDYQICYKYAMAIGFNTDPAVYKRGSAIFLHIKNPATWSSAGCVSVEEAYMLQLLKQCHNGAYIMIVPDTASIAAY